MINPLQNSYNVGTSHDYGMVAGKVADKFSAEHPRIILHQDGIRIGCAKISIDAAKHIISKWEEKFGNIKASYELQ